eukprot:gene17319-22860_t
MSKSSSFSSLENIDSDNMKTSLNEDDTNLIINYLPHDMKDSELRDLFNEHGDIIMCKIVREKVTKRSLGYGFVKYLTEEQAQDAITKKHGLQLGNKKLKVAIARPSSDIIKNSKLYVTNIPPIATDDIIVDLFSQYGKIIEHRIVRRTHCKNSDNGVCFIQYSLKAEATAGK